MNFMMMTRHCVTLIHAYILILCHLICLCFYAYALCHLICTQLSSRHRSSASWPPSTLPSYIERRNIKQSFSAVFFSEWKATYEKNSDFLAIFRQSHTIPKLSSLYIFISVSLQTTTSTFLPSHNYLDIGNIKYHSTDAFITLFSAAQGTAI